MMQCAFCKDDIDADSHYCDMCGEEVKLCPGCQKPGKGKICTACGKKLETPELPVVSSDDSALQSDIVPLPAIGEKAPTQKGVDSTFRLPDVTQPILSVPELRIINKNINVDAKIEDNSIIGRTTGPYVQIFGSYNQVSSRHCSFQYDSEKGWSVTDLGSTNKTLYNQQPLVPKVPQVLSDQGFLKIANIEFFVRIVPVN